MVSMKISRETAKASNPRDGMEWIERIISMCNSVVDAGSNAYESADIPAFEDNLLRLYWLRQSLGDTEIEFED